VTADELDRRLKAERVVRLTADEWSGIVDRFEEVQRHSTLVAGDLLIVRSVGGLAAVEQPSPGERAVRRLDDEDEVRRFVADRLGRYERMWDGCGCKVDYYS
jgi:hypothetical protein